MSNIKKIKLYEVNPRFFKDGTGNGIGDLKGMISKAEYFSYLGIDAVILQDILSSESNDNIQDFTKIAKDLGTNKELKKFSSESKDQGTRTFLELKIGSIRESHKWFENAETSKTSEFKDVVEFSDKQEKTANMDFKYSKEQKGYYAIDSKTQEVPLNWKSNKVLENFIRVIRFWVDLGIDGFVFREFEFVSNAQKNRVMNSETLKELRKFYMAIKEIDDNITIIGKSSIIGMENTNRFTEGSTKVFDYFMDQQIPLLGNSLKYGTDEIGKFKPNEIASAIKKYVNNESNILTFGSSFVGRITSRWGDGGQYNVETAKSLGILLSLTPGSFSIYYGDEIGTLNIGLTHLDDFQDMTLVKRKKEYAIKGLIKEKDFMDAQVLQNPINARSLMSWSTDKNGGFSNSEKTITPISTTYREINVANQFKDKGSTLNFFKKLMEISSNRKYNEIITSGKFSISTTISGVIRMSSTLGGEEIIALINLTDKVKKAKKNKNSRVIISSYAHKKYSSAPTKLEAFESVVIFSSSKKLILQDTQSSNYDEEPSTKNKNDIKKSKPKNLKNSEKDSLTKAKVQAQAEREAARLLKQGAKTFSIMDEEIHESERTILTEDDIAATTQIDMDDIDDINAFINKK